MRHLLLLLLLSGCSDSLTGEATPPLRSSAGCDVWSSEFYLPSQSGSTPCTQYCEVILYLDEWCFGTWPNIYGAGFYSHEAEIYGNEAAAKMQPVSSILLNGLDQHYDLWWTGNQGLFNYAMTVKDGHSQVPWDPSVPSYLLITMKITKVETDDWADRAPWIDFNDEFHLLDDGYSFVEGPCGNNVRREGIGKDETHD